MSVSDRRIPEGVWESEVMARAAGWIVVMRGASLALGGGLGLLAAWESDADRVAWLGLVVPAALATACGMAILGRVRWVRAPLTVALLGWIVFVIAPLAPPSWGLQGAWDPLEWTSEFRVRLLLPALLVPDLFALHALLRRGAREVLQPSADPLAAVASAWRIRLNGRVVVSLAMVVLAFVSSAACLLGLPGLVLA